MDISIIIVNFNTYQITYNCIASIINHVKGVDFEILLIDNASSDAPPSKFKEAFPTITLIECSENVGFARANNIGMKQAKGKYLLLLNPDTLLIDNSVQRCFNFMESSKAKEDNVGLLSVKLLNGDGTFQHSTFPYLKDTIWIYFLNTNPLANKIRQLFRNDPYVNFDPNKNQFVGDISGAFMFMRKEIAESTGYFDTDFFMFCEDTEWCRLRINKVSRILYFAEGAIIHLGGQSAPHELMYIQSKLSLSLFWYKRGYPKYIAYLIVTGLNYLTTLILFPLFSQRSRNSEMLFLKAYVKIFRYLFTDVPKYPRELNSRKEILVYTPAKSKMNLL